MVCASEQAAIIDKEIYDEFVNELKSYHTYFVNKKEKALLEEFCFGVKANSKNCAGAKLNANTLVNQPHGLLNKLDSQFQKEQTFLLQNVKKLAKKEPFNSRKTFSSNCST